LKKDEEDAATNSKKTPTPISMVNEEEGPLITSPAKMRPSSNISKKSKSSAINDSVQNEYGQFGSTNKKDSRASSGQKKTFITATSKPKNLQNQFSKKSSAKKSPVEEYFKRGRSQKSKQSHESQPTIPKEEDGDEEEEDTLEEDIIGSVGQERMNMQSNIMRKELINEIQQVDSDDDDDDDEMDMDMSENPTGKKMISYVASERAPEISRIKKIPNSIVTNPINGSQRHSIAF